MYMDGRFDPGGAPSLRAFVSDTIRTVPGKRADVFSTWDRRWKALGSGADFVPFQDHLGIAALSIEFIGPNGYGFGTYHSNYDSRAYVEKVADPDFGQGVVMARVLGALALRMSEAAILPFRFAEYAERLGQTVADARKWADESKIAVDADAWLARVRQIELAATHLAVLIDRRLEVEGGDFSALNDRLARLEQKLADDDGAADSRWYRHVFYGWNIYSLYDGQMFPGLATAMRRRDATRVQHEAARIERALDRMHGELTAASADVR